MNLHKFLASTDNDLDVNDLSFLNNIGNSSRYSALFHKAIELRQVHQNELAKRKNKAVTKYSFDILPFSTKAGKALFTLLVREIIAARDPERDVKNFKVVFADDVIDADREVFKNYFRQYDRYPIVVVFLTTVVTTTIRHLRNIKNITDIIPAYTRKLALAMSEVQVYPLEEPSFVSLERVESGVREDGSAKIRFNVTSEFSDGSVIVNRYVHRNVKSPFPKKFSVRTLTAERYQEFGVVYVYRVMFESSSGPRFVYKTGKTKVALNCRDQESVNNALKRAARKRALSYSHNVIHRASSVDLVFYYICSSEDAAFRLEQRILSRTVALGIEHYSEYEQFIHTKRRLREYRVPEGNARFDFFTYIRDAEHESEVEQFEDLTSSPLRLISSPSASA
ncbi:hypothetical protein [Idiomarina baltica]|uniref:Uncharacterized protein n=1 Tax=Idiomarina baltica OS145 TaxID=314276 RepID=A0ABP2CR33_9GAMM|nr:hypothetical protein [Idiomarina baltica]EAQ32313.1 hypothetical protein OS145_07691 [Idiomarina baltica OS145]